MRNTEVSRVRGEGGKRREEPKRAPLAQIWRRERGRDSELD